MHNQALAEYLPAEDHPQYAEYEASYEQYKNSLDRRYPQVCADCEPRVRAGIKDAGYKAKTDHLQRMVAASKEGRAWRRSRLGWRWILVSLGGLAWWVSVLTQALWHAAGAVLTEDNDEMSGVDTLNWNSCLRHTGGAWGFEVEKSCFNRGGQVVKWSLLAALLSFWWNPRLKDKFQGSIGSKVHISGLSEHLWLQAITIVTRCGAWAFLRNGQARIISWERYHGAHLFMVLFLFLTTICSLNVVKSKRRARVLFTDDVPPLIPADDDGQASSFRQSMAQTQTPVFQSRAGYEGRRFPVDALANSSPSFPRAPPSPPPDDIMSVSSIADTSTTDLDNAMDWAPTPQQPSFHPRRPVTDNSSFAAQQRVAEYDTHENRPSPFYGALPPRPQPPAHKLRNPYTSVFQRPAPATKENFFAQVMKKGGSSSLEHADPFAANPSGHDRGWMELAQPQWQYEEQRPADTGLEAMFDSVFTIRDEPAEVQQREAKRASRRVSSADDGAHATSIAGTPFGRATAEQQAQNSDGDLSNALLLWGVPVAVAAGIFALKAVGAVSFEAVKLF